MNPVFANFFKNQWVFIIGVLLLIFSFISSGWESAIFFISSIICFGLFTFATFFYKSQFIPFLKISLESVGGKESNNQTTRNKVKIKWNFTLELENASQFSIKKMKLYFIGKFSGIVFTSDPEYMNYIPRIDNSRLCQELDLPPEFLRTGESIILSGSYDIEVWKNRNEVENLTNSLLPPNLINLEFLVELTNEHNESFQQVYRRSKNEILKVNPLNSILISTYKSKMRRLQESQQQYLP